LGVRLGYLNFSIASGCARKKALGCDASQALK
jgi:hypothetical protein